MENQDLCVWNSYSTEWKCPQTTSEDKLTLPQNVQNIFAVTAPQYWQLWFYYRTATSVHRSHTASSKYNIYTVRAHMASEFTRFSHWLVDYLSKRSSTTPASCLNSFSFFICFHCAKPSKPIFNPSVSYLSFIFGFFARLRWMLLPFLHLVQKIIS